MPIKVLTCPTTSKDWEQFEEKFRTRWNVTEAVGALDGKHITMKKPKKPGSEFYNHKGFFSLLLLALVNTDYRFLWVDVWSSGSSLDAQIFNHSKYKKISRMTPWGFQHLNPLGRKGQNFTIFCFQDTPILIPWLGKPYCR